MRTVRESRRAGLRADAELHRYGLPTHVPADWDAEPQFDSEPAPRINLGTHFITLLVGIAIGIAMAAAFVAGAA